MKSIVLLLLLIGVILITLGITKTNTKKCPIDIQRRTVDDTYLNKILSSSENYKQIFNYSNIGIPDNLSKFGNSNNESNLDQDDDNNSDNIHNMI